MPGLAQKIAEDGLPEVGHKFEPSKLYKGNKCYLLVYPTIATAHNPHNPHNPRATELAQRLISLESKKQQKPPSPLGNLYCYIVLLLEDLETPNPPWQQTRLGYCCWRHRV